MDEYISCLGARGFEMSRPLLMSFIAKSVCVGVHVCVCVLLCLEVKRAGSIPTFTRLRAGRKGLEPIDGNVSGAWPWRMRSRRGTAAELRFGQGKFGAVRGRKIICRGRGVISEEGGH